jgi:hypothetical protein
MAGKKKKKSKSMPPKRNQSASASQSPNPDPPLEKEAETLDNETDNPEPKTAKTSAKTEGSESTDETSDNETPSPSSEDSAPNSDADKDEQDDALHAARNADDGGESPSEEKGEEKGAAWGAAIERFESKWVKGETWLIVVVLLCEIAALCTWIFLKGLSTTPTAGKAGIVFRMALTAVVLASATWVGTRKLELKHRQFATTSMFIVGFLLGKTWVNVGHVYGSELINWYQDCSTLTLFGGLKGIGTRLTIAVALLGASIAASSGKHINIDVLMRFIPAQARRVAASAAWLSTAVMLTSAAWGFFDFISVTNFETQVNDSAGVKISKVYKKTKRDLFILRRQMGIDFTVGFRVFAGKRFTKSLSGAEWNEKIQNGGYESYFTKEQIQSLLVPQDQLNQPRNPRVIIPETEVGGLLSHDLNMLFPLGFIVIAFKFLLRVLLVISGRLEIDPAAAHKEEDMKPVELDDDNLPKENV